MTVLAVCGPIGSDFKAFSEQCYSLLNKEKTLLIDSSAYISIDELLSAIKAFQGNVIIYGAGIFLEEQLRPAFDINVFLELDADLCLSNYLRSSTTTKSIEDLINYYVDQIKPLNEKIRSSAQFANLRRTQESSNDKLIELIINTIIRVETPPSASQDRNRFYKSTAYPSSAMTNSDRLSNLGLENSQTF